MSWILHLSDPHLGDVSPGQELDDEKVVLKRQRDLETTQRVFTRTLRALKWLIEDRGRPDAVIVSGDLTYQARRSGFDRFVKLLTEQADVLPSARDRIVVVPGNHDVVWDEAPGTKPRYAPFIAATRDHGCATPLLDGVDFHGDDGSLDPDADKHAHVVATDDLLIVPINSSNYCGTLVDLPRAWPAEKWEEKLAPLGDGLQEALAQLKRMRQHDMARVSRAQIEALGRLFDKLGLAREARGDDRVRVAVIHHQLLPVSTREERKTFESLVNLGLVRQTLREYGFDAVLHGHKHESSLYWDFVRLESDPIEVASRRMLVVAAPGHFDSGQPTLRAMILVGNERARNLRILTFNGVGPHAKKAPVGTEETAPLWVGAMESESQERVVVRAPTAQRAYARLRALFELQGPGEMRNFVCEIEDPADAGVLPPDYPDVPTDDAESWFRDLVDWWQLDRSELVDQGVLPFNHGERIYRRWGDQIERAIRMLNARGDSSRALVELIGPGETGRYASDRRHLHRGSYPAFALAEFSLVTRDGRRQLDCFGYFRKQEMQYWWPVNVAELRLLQEKVRAGLTRAALAGRIVTFSAIALWGEQLPGVAVPEIDRLAEHPDRIWQMAAAICFPGKSRDAAKQDWQRVLAELTGDGRDEPPRPALGHELLLAELQRFAGVRASNGLGDVIARLEDLCQRYEAHAGQDLNQAAVSLIREAVAGLQSAVEVALQGKSRSTT